MSNCKFFGIARLTAPMLGFVCESDKDLECESRKPMNMQFDIKFHVKLQVLWDCETLTAPMLGFVCESDKDLECESRKPMNLQFDIKFHVKLQVLWDCETLTAPVSHGIPC